MPTAVAAVDAAAATAPATSCVDALVTAVPVASPATTPAAPTAAATPAASVADIRTTHTAPRHPPLQAAADGRVVDATSATRASPVGVAVVVATLERTSMAKDRHSARDVDHGLCLEAEVWHFPLEECRVPSAECRVPSAECRVPSAKGAKGDGTS